MEEMFSNDFWKKWYAEVNVHIIDPRRSIMDHIEIGAVPIKTKDGWLLIYSYIENYHRENNPFKLVFGIETLLLDLNDPRKIIGKTRGPILAPTEIYEKSGQVLNVIFPSGALINKNILEIYYGAADTFCCKATVNLDNLLFNMHPDAMETYVTRYKKNPILIARAGVDWEAHGVFNPASIKIENTTHILYRAMSSDDTSSIGYARSEDGFVISERGDKPIYVPRERFEMKTHPGNSGCEDPRLTRIGNIIYMCYTAYDGSNPPRVALTSIRLQDFLDKNWLWTKPFLISPKGLDDKDACIFPEKIGNSYFVLHRINSNICLDAVNSFNFSNLALIGGTPIMLPRAGEWDSEKVGITAPPIKTKKGWLVLYHGVSSNHHTYRVGIALLDLKNPRKILARAIPPIFDPEMPYEKNGVMPNVVFPCGTTLRGDTLFIYYGGADDVVGVATVSMKRLLNSLL